MRCSPRSNKWPFALSPDPHDGYARWPAIAWTKGRPSQPPHAPCENRLLRRIHEQGDARARDRLAEEMLPLARALAGRYANRGEPLDDLVQVACIGIMKAIDGFDLTREVRFSSYATPTVLGRSSATSATRRGPCASRAACRSCSCAWPRHATSSPTSSGRSPTVQELADAVQAPFEEVLATIQSVSARRTRSLDEPDGRGRHAGRLARHRRPRDRARRDARAARRRLRRALRARPGGPAPALRARPDPDRDRSAHRRQPMQVSRLIRESLARMRMDIERSPERKSRIA